jgi:RNA polymerase sigma-70 factor (ECF subfamily)
MPNEPEACGLLALMLHCEARHAARFTNSGEFVPLDQQDTALWSRPMIDAAENHLRSAAAFKRMGCYQLEAAIQSVHADRMVSGRIDWPEIVLLYEGLVQIAPGIGSLVGRAVALAQAGNPAAGLPDSKKFLRIELPTISPIGPPAGICWNCSIGKVKRETHSPAQQA